MRILIWVVSRVFYRLRVFGRENVPTTGGALLVSNHVSWLDGILLMFVNTRRVRNIVFVGNFTNPYFNWLGRRFGSIYVSSNPKAIIRALAAARQALIDGDVVCIFAEGGITRSGQVQAFRPGLTRILRGTDAPVVPVYLDGLWGSIFSYSGGKFLWKLPKRWPYPISVHFGKPMRDVKDVHEVRQAVQLLGAQAVTKKNHESLSLPREFIRSCKKRKFKSKAADSSGADMTGGQLLMRTLILRRLLQRHVFESNEQYVGILLPPTAGAVVTNAALALDQRITVNLNYTVTSDILNQCIRECGIKHVLTSREFIEKIQEMQEGFSLDAELIYLEDFRPRVTTFDKLNAAVSSYLLPTAWLHFRMGLSEIKSDDVLTVIFTSGSTGAPKGVMLTWGNVSSNVVAIDQVIHLHRDDVLVGILPFFHSFGFTVTLWAAMSLDIKGIYHFNPLEGKQVGKLIERHRGTILLSTPTFLRTYLRRCTPEQFSSLDVVVAGAEKLPQSLAESFQEKFNVLPVEGYGTTELSPLVSVNIPPSRSGDNFQLDRKAGSVGRPAPGISVKVVGLESGEDLGVDESGMLMVTGPNVMKGYLNHPDKTAEVIRDGWYVTGDVAQIDDQGFITITGRESRFSKIGGEMVPHIQIEEELNNLIGADDENGLMAAVTAVPDTKKGERLIVLHRPLGQSPDELRAGLATQGLPNIFIPSADSFCEVEEFPVLGTGKLDLKRIKQMALERFCEVEKT